MSEWFVAVGFERGTILIDVFRDIFYFFPPERARTYRYILEIPFRGTLQLWRTVLPWVAHRLIRGRHLYGHEELVKGFVTAVSEGTPPPVSAEEGYEVVRLLEQILESAGPADTLPAR